MIRCKRKIPDAGTPMEIEDTPVYEVAQEKIINGKVSKTVAEKLEEEYPEWKNNHKIYMIPLVFKFKNKGQVNFNGPDAERAVFNTLEKINERTCITDNFRKTPPYLTTMFGFVFHDRRFGGEEVDFLYVSIYGVIVMECKGVKRITQANSNYRFAREQLVKRVEIVGRIISCLGLPESVPIFKVVSFPNLKRCDIKILDETHILFKEDLGDLKTWLRRELGFLSSDNVIGVENYEKIATAFLTEYHTNEAGKFINRREFKKRAILDSENKLETFFTKKQAELVKVGHCKKLWITGAAGTGKTLVLKNRVKFLTELNSHYENNAILVITYNIPVNMDIEQWVQSNTNCDGKLVRVQTFSALLGHIIRELRGDNRLFEVQRMEDEDKIDYILENKLLEKYLKSRYAKTSKYHHIFVDEAQDLPGKWLELLYGLLRRKAESSIWIFEDPYQVVRKNSVRPDCEPFEKHQLTTVFRNTHNVFEAYKHCHETLRDEVTAIEKSFSDEELCSPTIEHDVYGSSPEYITQESNEQLNKALVATLRRLQSQGVKRLDVAVITRGNQVCNVRQHLETAGITSENAEKAVKLKYCKRNKNYFPIIVESYQRFKGLESRVVIFFIPSFWQPQDVEIYVGFSRSFCHLIVIGTSKMISEIKRRQDESMQKNV